MVCDPLGIDCFGSHRKNPFTNMQDPLYYTIFRDSLVASHCAICISRDFEGKSVTIRNIITSSSPMITARRQKREGNEEKKQPHFMQDCSSKSLLSIFHKTQKQLLLFGLFWFDSKHKNTRLQKSKQPDSRDSHSLSLSLSSL